MLKDVSALLLVVAAALIHRDGRVLVQQRPLGKPMAGLWEFPGGKVEPGEFPEAALARELAEELGIGLDTSRLVPLTFASEALDGRHLVLLLYTLREWSGIPEPRHATALRWAKPAELRLLEMPPADLPFIPILDALL
ncbi:(deoxy)nucleoside triphosphate pyrophosphohydrolase [Sphingomonas sp.]|uniref:(deoxy)nucleoside triphosphate pyrophosphohydrolase n=1 Tax=Sphingomonas sp. TaxID=28214 RepID=UPI0039C90036